MDFCIPAFLPACLPAFLPSSDVFFRPQFLSSFLKLFFEHPHLYFFCPRPKIGALFSAITPLMALDSAGPELLNPEDPLIAVPPSGFAEVFNHPKMRVAEIPSAGMHATAKGMGRVAMCLANGGELDGVRIISEESLALAHSDVVERMDAMLSMPTFFSKAGWCRFGKGNFFIMGQSSQDRKGYFGWMGLGGSSFMWHNTMQLGFGYAQNAMNPDPGNAISKHLQIVRVHACMHMYMYIYIYIHLYTYMHILYMHICLCRHIFISFIFLFSFLHLPFRWRGSAHGNCGEGSKRRRRPGEWRLTVSSETLCVAYTMPKI